MRLYLHTINGRPAGFGNEQICYASNNRSKWKAKPIKDLATIRKQQKQTFEFRKEQGYSFDESEYSYVIIEIDDTLKLSLTKEVKK